MLGYTKKLPDYVELSNHLKEQADGYFIAQLTGKHYYIPMTKDCKKLFGIKRLKETVKFTNRKFMDEYKFADFLKTVIDSIYLQVRETVGREISDEVMREVKDKLDNVIAPQIDQEITKRFETKDKLLGDGK